MVSRQSLVNSKVSVDNPVHPTTFARSCIDAAHSTALQSVSIDPLSPSPAFSLTMAPTKNNKVSISQAILNATASLGGKNVCRLKVAKRCGHPKQEKVYTNALRLLKTKKGYLDYDKETITLNDEGIKNAVAEAPIGSNDQALERAKSKVAGNKAKMILDIVMDGKVHSKVEIAEKINHDVTKKSFGNLLGKVKSEGFIATAKTEDGKDGIVGTDELFPFGRPDSEDDE